MLDLEDDLEPESDEELFRNPVYYEAASRNLDLDRADLGVPEEPGLLHKLLSMRGRIPVERRGLICPDCRDLRGRRVAMYLVQRDGIWLASHYRKPGEKRITHESDEHLARKDRVAKDVEDHGHHAEMESTTADGKARLDVRITGSNGIVLGYEPQLSVQSARTMRLREGFRRRAGVRSIWDFTDPDHHGVGRVPYVRTPGLPASVIRVQKNPIEVRDGNFVLEEGNCTPGGGIERCPNKPYDSTNPLADAYCHQWHLVLVPEHLSSRARDSSKPRLTLTQLVVEAADGARIPFQRDGQHGWLPVEHWERLQSAEPPASPEPHEARAMLHRGDRRDRCTEDRPASDVRAEPTIRRGSRTFVLETRDISQPRTRPQAPPARRDIPGVCASGATNCGNPARLYPSGWRCEDHRPGAPARHSS